MINFNEYYTLKNGKAVPKVTLAQVQIEFQRKPFQKKPKDIENIKKLLVKFSEQNLLPNELRKMHACIKNVKTKKELEEAIKLAEKYAEQHDKRISDKKKQNKETFTSEPLSEKEFEEILSGVMKHPSLALLADETRQKIIFGDVKCPTEYDKDIVQESDNPAVVEKAQFAYLAREIAYIGRHLERLCEEKIEGDIAEWYKRAESSFTYRLVPIRGIYNNVEDVLAGRLPYRKEDFKLGFRKLLAVAKQCDIDRTGWFGQLPVKPIHNFKLAAKEFWETIRAIHTDACIALDKLTKQDGNMPMEKITKLTDFIRDKCEDATSISSKVNRIHEFVKNHKIDFMPKPVNKPKNNETKLYNEKELRKIWPKLKEKIKSLPNLKA
jgi:hypothetical protein